MMTITTIRGGIVSLLVIAQAWGQSNIDADNKWAWSENCGWTNWQHDAPEPGDGVIVTPTHLAGFAWGENIGWINLGDGDGPYVNDMTDSSTFGVNLDLITGFLSGFAWAENVGWFNFDGGAAANPPNPARLEGCRFRGFAWGENIGWINLDDDEHFIQVEGIGCDDGDPCTIDETCSDGICSGSPVVCYPPIMCPGDNPCMAAACDPSGPEGNCDACTPVPDGTECNDDDACTTDDICLGGACSGTPIECPDDPCVDWFGCFDGGCIGTPVDCSGAGDQCNTASCDPNGAHGNCDILTPVPDGEPCDDGQLCTKNDQCKAGACVGDEVVCPADLDGDCDVDAADLAELLGDWGLCDEPCEPGDPATTCASDLTGDCIVEAFDLAILLGSWGSCLE